MIHKNSCGAYIKMEIDECERDVYSTEIDELLEDDELSPAELGFMSGYNKA